MPIEQALEELKKYAKDFVAIGDANEYIKTNKEDFIHKWTKVNQYYNYIVNNTKGMSDEFFMAVDIISDIPIDNPSLEEWINLIIEPKKEKEKNQEQSQESISTDIPVIVSQIESYVSEIRNMQSWDQEYIEDIEWQLQEYQKMLISSQSSFEPQLYQILMNDINLALEKIGRFNYMLDSETMESIKRM